MFQAGRSTGNRLGFHYFADTLHYREKDLQEWLPRLKMVNAAWLTLLAPLERAIPESFLNGLLASGIQPVLHLVLPTRQSPDLRSLKVLFASYARWGVKYLALFDAPNSRQSWLPAAWAQDGLVDRFLDLYLPAAEVALQEGLQPLFPPLEPGGDYWDLVFLRLALRSLQRRRQASILDSLILTAYTWAGERPLDWGAAGPERWSRSRPYITPRGEQDHLGFRLSDWYLAVADQELGRRPPLILLRAGLAARTSAGGTDQAGQRWLQIARLVTARPASSPDFSPDDPLDPAGELLPPEVLACNLWLLAAAAVDPHADQAWFDPQGVVQPAVQDAHRWLVERQALAATPDAQDSPEASPSTVLENLDSAAPVPDSVSERLIEHYVLVPLYAWGAADWDMQAIQTLLQAEENRSRPTIGFSLVEARLAKRVTVVGGEGAFPAATLDALRASGCQVDRLARDGTFIAP